MALNVRSHIVIAAIVVFVVVMVLMLRTDVKVRFRPGHLVDQIEPAVEVIKGMTQGNVAPSPNPVLEKLRRNGMVILPDTRAMETMDEEALYQTYHSYLDNIDIRCNRKLRMGKVGDGGWEVCDDEKYRPSSNCVAYSFGVNNDFSFDDDISRLYNCLVISFDPSMKSDSYRRSPRVYFLKMGIAEKNYDNPSNWQLRTLGFFMNQFNHSKRVIDVLKLDVEFAEWPSLSEMVFSGHLRQVKQLLVEYHGRPTNKTILLSELGLLKDISDLGFRKFYVHKNANCHFDDIYFPVQRTICYEVHYVNVNLE